MFNHIFQSKKRSRDDELKKAQEKAMYYRSHSLHELSDNEIKKIRVFRKAHYDSCKNGSTFLFGFTGTGIGEAITIKCPICGKEENVTDYNDW